MLAISSAGRRYGAFHNIHPDEPVKHLARSAPFPPLVDTREFCGPVKDQGNEGSCTGHAGSSACEWIDRRYRKLENQYSPAYLYAQELLREGTFPSDAGADPLSICHVLSLSGICLESEMPYAPGTIVAPTDAQNASAAKNKLGGYHKMGGIGDYLSCLANPTPWPVLVGFDVFDSFESPQVAATGLMPIPKPGESYLGGHEVLGVGYDLTRRVGILQNSWGSGWGDRGFFYMPFEVLDRSVLRIIHPGFW